MFIINTIKKVTDQSIMIKHENIIILLDILEPKFKFTTDVVLVCLPVWLWFDVWTSNCMQTELSILSSASKYKFLLPLLCIGFGTINKRGRKKLFNIEKQRNLEL
jgi:hypothetical protein